MPITNLPEPFGKQEIETVLPHGSGFIYVDEIVSFKSHEDLPQIIGARTVLTTEWWTKDHFPNNPIMPGNLILEGRCQTAAILAYLLNDKDSGVQGFVTGYDKIRFKRPARPNDVIIYDVKKIQHRLGTFKFEAEARVNGNVLVTCSSLLLSQSRL